ncbi:Late embryogenesis abundant protein 2 [Gemmatirosa kalamazoonensis]|uniref:Late embryogenesis abundant protein 2 n=1 Tax=Gemmatirosa kalamazoonensis TaxID=861299 RepID=W0RIW6_9BACT|nr:LEA type 2 family protein [Gemmatirosa kalamazoonensis]AHG91044.1 Late embryogenesis abundant protein 2 [Gemmatirosa kalamazoonensis]
MIRRFVGVLGVGLAVATAGTVGCAALGMGGFKDPIVTFRDVRINGLGVAGGSADVVLSVYNPNGFKLEGVRLTYNLMVDSTPVGNGALDDRFTVQKGESTEVRLPVSFTYAGLGAAGRQLMQSGSVRYRVLGDVTVATPLGNFTRPYDRTGSFSSFGRTSR